MESATRENREGGYSVAPAGALRAHRYLPRVPSCREGPLPARSKLDELLGRGPAAKLLARSGTGEHREFKLDKKQRIITRDSGSSHAMTLKSVDIDENGKTVKWQVENSWGASSGYKGTLIMTDEWFDEYMFRLVVDKKYVPAKVLKVLEEKPTMLPAWDPMFMPEE